MPVLEDVFYGDYSACTPSNKEDYRLEADKNRLECRIARFAEALTDDDKKEFNLIMNARNELTSREAYSTFKKGVDFGFGFMNAIYKD